MRKSKESTTETNLADSVNSANPAKSADAVASSLTTGSGTSLKSKRGIALISVLTIVTLATILVLTFFTLARNEMVASVNYSDGLHAKHLSETAVNMVIGQIRRATEDGDRVWATQPGAIRAYDGTNGEYDAGYKLYSSGTMVDKSSEASLVDSDFAGLGEWSSKLWKYADLNEPVIRADRIYYPVVDPRARDFPNWDEAREYDDAGIEGFDWNTDGIADSPMKDALAEITDPLTGRAYDALPMPVEWMYQLQDGTLGALDDSRRFVAYGGGGTATKENPIIGRVAFWTDDETCKTNVNVHAGGTAWDTPRAGGDIDRNLGRYQPAQHEWQRYPGHPATTSLAPVLFPGMKNITLSRDEMEKIFRLVPRIVGGGSSSGTRAVNPNDPKENNGLIPDKDRLYPSLDDFILKPGGNRGFDHTDPQIAYGSREESVFPRLAGEQSVDDLLEQSRFFLTVTSRAPEVNLFNQPRVSIWPTHYDPSGSTDKDLRNTPFDRVIRFCSQLGETSPNDPHRYYFQRHNADSASDDWNDIQRNQEVYAYLDRLTKREVPGYGGSFEDKYGKENRLQMLTMMFDYIRSSNLFDDTLYQHAAPDNPNSWRAAYSKENENDHLTFTNYRTSSERGLHMGHGQVAPIHIPYQGVDTKGMGRFYTVDEVALQLICCAEGARLDPGDPDFNNKYLRQILGESRTQLVDPEGGTGDSVVVYSNCPPMHLDFRPLTSPAEMVPNYKPHFPEHTPVPAKIATWPAWYKRLYDDTQVYNPSTMQRSPTHETSIQRILYANQPANWNWLLAYNMAYYRDEIIGKFKFEEKFSRDWITKDMTEDPEDVTDAAGESMRLGPQESMVQAVFLIEMFSPSAGWTSIAPDMKIEVDTSNITFTTADNNPRVVGFPKLFQHPYDNTGTSQHTWVSNRHNFSAVWGGRNNGAGGGFRSLMRSTVSRQYVDSNGNSMQPDLSNDKYVGDPAAFLRVYPEGGSNSTIEANGETIWYRGWDAGRRAFFDRSALASAPMKPSASDYRGGNIDASNLYPMIGMPFRASRGGVLAGGASGASNVELRIYANRGFSGTLLGPDADKERFQSKPQIGSTATKGAPELVQTIRVHMQLGAMPTPFLATGTIERRNEFDAVINPSTSPMRWWSASFDGPNPATAPAGRLASVNRSPGGGDGQSARNGKYIRDGDTVWGYAPPHGDQRMTASKWELGTNDPLRFRKHPNAGGTTRLAHSLTTAVGGRHFPAKDNGEGAKREYEDVDEVTDQNYPAGKQPLPLAGKKSREKYQLYGDFDNGQGGSIDGAFINKVDEGNTHSLRKRTVSQSPGSWEWRRDYGSYPYFVREWTHEPSGPAFFSPNRMMPSPVVFGSMPTEVFGSDSENGNDGAWQTLLFRPNVVGVDNGYYSHPGAKSPPDHMLLDLFWMPVVEPYAVSEPSSTAGRVNMNYQILPFTNITRTSALRGVFQSEYMLCIPNKHVRNYKVGVGRGRGYHWLYKPFDGELQRLSLRSVIVEKTTLDQFEEKFTNKEIFLTASEICDIHLMPQDIGEKQGFANKTGTFTPDLSEMQNGTYWAQHRVVGDNGRETPYAHIYPRLTTKSNTFKVHIRSQIVKKARDSDPAVWDPDLDTSVAEYRGSAIVERYVEPNDPEIPDYVTNASAPTLDLFYKFRVVNEKRFSP